MDAPYTIGWRVPMASLRAQAAPAATAAEIHNFATTDTGRPVGPMRRFRGIPGPGYETPKRQRPSDWSEKVTDAFSFSLLRREH